jgi:acyl carrier protein
MVTKLTVDGVVLSIFSKILEVAPPHISSGDDFASLGGGSFEAMEIAAALRKTYPALAIVPEDVLRARTPAGLADFIKRQGIG